MSGSVAHVGRTLGGLLVKLAAVTAFTLQLFSGVLRSRLRRSKCAKLVVFFSNCDSVDFHHQLLQQQQQSWVGDADAAAVAEALLGSTPVLKLHGDMKQPERTSSLVTFAKVKIVVMGSSQL